MKRMDGMDMNAVDETGQMPGWREAKGTRVRVALWLATEVGEGGTFKKQQLRDAMPGVEQIDRRMRDLRPAGWKISTYRDRAALGADELMLEKIGLPVWEKEHRAAGLRAISARTRQEVMNRDFHRCVRCGILAGEAYPDDPSSTARLTLGHVHPHKHGSGSTPSDLVTECARCNESVQHFTESRLSFEQVWDRVQALTGRDKNLVLRWIVKGHRDASPAERAVGLINQLSAVDRDAVKARLVDFVGGPVDGAHVELPEDGIADGGSGEELPGGAS
jgi:hypothetical protein